MKRLFVVLSIGTILLTVGGCSHHHPRNIASEHYHNRHHDYQAPLPSRKSVVAQQTQYRRSHHLHDNLLQGEPIITQSQHVLSGWRPPVHSFRPAYTHKLLSDYAEQITMKLVENMRYVTVNTPVAVASFVDLDSTLSSTNLLGNQLAESFITELQEFGIPILDYKTTGVIHVGQNGDYVFSRNLGELKPNPAIKYVLSGTMTYNDRGVILNVRIVDLASKVIVASAKGFIPQFVAESLYPKSMVDGILLNSTS